MNLRFNSDTGDMMTQTLTAIINLSVSQKRLTVNQTMVFTAYILFLLSDAVNC